MSESKEHLLADAESSYHDASTADEHLSLHRQMSGAGLTKSLSFWKCLRIAAYTWAVLCTVPALLFLVDTISNDACYVPIYTERT
jgi:hypothetical protein